MANKRIELEHYRRYVNLTEEEPNHKRVRNGFLIVAIVAMLLAVLFFVLGVISNDLAQNPRNVLEKPPEKTETPNSSPSPGIPGGGTELPNETPASPSGGQGASPRESATAFLPAGAHDGSLLAQAEPAESAPGEYQPNASAPTQNEPPSSAPQQSPPEKDKKPEKKGPGEQTSGVGNLSNLANGVSGRGFQLYMLALAISLIVVLYVALRRSRLERKSR